MQVPTVHWDMTTSDVLTMERVAGVGLNRKEELSALQVDRQRLAKDLAEIFLHQFFKTGLFHADPHPGNILVTPDGRIGLVDFGMAGRLDTELRRQLATSFIAMSRRDLDVITDVYMEIGAVSDEADLFLYDVKIVAEHVHREYLGISNNLILSNLRLLADQGRDVWLRIPVLPGINDDEENLNQFMSLILELSGIQKICLIPFQAVEQNAFTCPGTLRDEAGNLYGPAESAEKIKEKLLSVTDRVVVVTPG